MNVVYDWFKRTFSDPQMVVLMVMIIAAALSIMLFAHMLVPAIAAIVIAFLLDGPVEWLRRRHVGQTMSVTIVFCGFMLACVIILLAVLPPLLKQVASFIADTPAMVAEVQKGLLDLHEKMPDVFTKEQINSWFANLGGEITNMGPRLLEYSLDGLTGLITAIVYLVLVPVMVFFFMKDKRQILGWIASFMPTDRALPEQVWREATARAGDYARGKVYEILIIAVAAFIIYQALGLRYATLLAVATGVSVLIPYIGAAVVTVPIALVSFFQWGVGPEMWSAIIAYLILQALDGNLLSPLLFSEVVKLHPNAIIVAVLVFGGIWGFWGVFFAIPLATVANAIIRAWRERTEANAQVAAET